MTKLASVLLTRRSVSPRRLCSPGPTDEMLAEIIGVGMRAPDHGGLLPWRVIEFGDESRAALADLFEAEKLRRDPLASQEDRLRAREHATHAPTVLAFVVRTQRNPLVPVSEQWLSAGAALGNILMAAHAMGFGAIMLSGERCQDAPLTSALGLQAHEVLAGFISIGTIAKTPPAAQVQPRTRVWSRWTPGAEVSAGRSDRTAQPADKASG